MFENISYARAREAVALGMKLAEEDFGRPVCVAVCDAAGNLLAFGRMDSAPLRSIAISQGKAYTACRMGTSTEAFHERLKARGRTLADFCDPTFTSLPGGAVVKDARGGVAGGIGISGLHAEEDQVIANALAAFCAA